MSLYGHLDAGGGKTTYRPVPAGSGMYPSIAGPTPAPARPASTPPPVTQATPTTQMYTNDQRAPYVHSAPLVAAPTSAPAVPQSTMYGQSGYVSTEQYAPEGRQYSPRTSSSYPAPTTTPHHPAKSRKRPSELADGTYQPRQSRGLVGLDNLGNTCFMNAAVQCLSHTVLLRNFFISGKYKSDLSSRKKSSLADAFGELVRLLWTEDGHLHPASFKRHVSKVAEQFQGYRQHDLQEFLRCLLDALHEELNRIKVKPPYQELNDDPRIPNHERARIAWEYYQSHSNSRITDIFAGQLGSYVKCQTCGFVTKAFDPFLDLSLPLPAKKTHCTLEDCLSKFTRRERLEGDDMGYCQRCRELRPSVKQLQIHQLPRVLVLHIKRFKFSGMYGETSTRLDTALTLPPDGLDMSAFCDRDGGMYDLCAVANHYGTLQGGHYTAQCYSVVKEAWHQYDDSRVSPSRPPAGGAEAYVLFYQRR